ncbi:Transducin/WD40 repeat-like superfamily protein [Raphanus sativus]|nr:Transducin/WD40 repeat-like superfamily protein [Raphanus sativus]
MKAWLVPCTENYSVQLYNLLNDRGISKGGSISFLEGYDKSQLRLAYVNGSREYVVFGLDSDEILERSAEGLAGDEETGGNLLGDFGYALLYGKLRDYDKKRMENVVSLATSPFVLSERQWETIFSGSTLNFPPRQKLCAIFILLRV